ncbi:MAG: hypothetical protein BGO90_11550 [Legionella sp. 40-6]|nr:protein BatD [Legionella sp.]OJY54828.1 MAG: hypothetical protein BGO90_11550 [Legionella sp. 40-6]
MSKFLIGFIFLFQVMSSWAEVQAEVDQAVLGMDETFRLIITQDGIRSGSGLPDLTPLKKDFIILGTEQNMSYTVINGQSQASNSWVISLKPIRSGTLTIPAIKVGSEHTSALTINVDNTAPQKPNRNAATDTNQDLFMKTTVNNERPYVNQQIIYKVAIYNSRQLLDATYEEPQLDNALVIPLGTNRRYQTIKTGMNYLVDEKTYAIFPLKSGKLTLTSPVYNALVFGFEPQKVRISDNNISLEVQPAPSSFQGKEWLPAREIKLTEDYESISKSLKVGDTLIRKVQLHGVGIPAQLLPIPHFAENKKYNVYPEKGKYLNQIQQGEIVSNIDIKVTYLFNQNGQITLPEAQLPWFNTKTGKEEIARLPAKTISILPSESKNSPAPAVTTLKTDKTSSQPEILKSSDTEKKGAILPWFLAGLCALAWLITLALWKWPRGKKSSLPQNKTPNLKALHKACKDNNPQAAQFALLEWAQARWPQAQLLNLGSIAQYLAYPPLEQEINRLSQVLYQAHTKMPWTGAELWSAVNSLPQKKEALENDFLPPSNPK